MTLAEIFEPAVEGTVPGASHLEARCVGTECKVDEAMPVHAQADRAMGVVGLSLIRNG